MPLPTRPRPGLRRMHQEMNSEVASSSSQLRAAGPPKRARVEEKVQTTGEDQKRARSSDEDYAQCKRRQGYVVETFEDCTRKNMVKK